MITATINGLYLEFPKSFEWELIQNSQLCSFDKIKGDVVPSISFPDTKRNRIVLNHPNRFELKRDGVKEFNDFELRSNGYLLIRGTLVLTDGFSGFVRGQAGTISAANTDKLITDYDLPADQLFINKSSYSQNNDDYCAPYLMNRNFFADLSKTYNYISNDIEYEETVLQNKHRKIGYAVNHQTGIGVLINNNDLVLAYDVNDTYILTVVSPQLFLFNIANSILKQNGFHIVSNALPPESEFLKLCIYNNVDINKGEATTATIKYGKETKSGEIWVLWEFEVEALTRSISTFNYSDLLPEISLKEFLLGIQNLLNIVFVFKPNNTIEIVDREAVITAGNVEDLTNYFTGKWTPGEKKNVSLKFLQLHDEDDALFGDFYEDLSDRADDFGEDVPDLATLEGLTGTKLGELRRVLSVERIYEWNYTVVISEDSLGLEKNVFGWRFISIDYQPGFVNYSPDKEIEEIKTCFSTLSGKATPMTQQLGRTNLRKSTEAPFSPRLLFYLGDGIAKNNTENNTLKFTGPNNLIEKRWQNWAEFWAKRERVVGYFRFSASILSTLDINRKYHTREGSFLIEKITTRFTHSGIKESKIEGYKA